VPTAALDAEAREILRANDLGGYTVPTHGLYPYQWNWDSALVALGQRHVDEARAWREIETLLTGQWDDGMVPHIVFHQVDPGYFPGPQEWGVEHIPPTSGITQPPVAATTVRRLYDSARAVDREAAARRLFPKLLAWHRWFHDKRDRDGGGLIGIVHPWESGRDNSPDWDAALAAVDIADVGDLRRRDITHVEADQRPLEDDYLRYMALVAVGRDCGWDPALLRASSPFWMLCPGFNAILLRAHRDLSELAWALGETSAATEIARWIAAMEAGFERLWDDEAHVYRCHDALTDEPVDSLGSAGFLPLYAGAASADQAPQLAERLADWLDQVRYGVPSCDPADPRFEPKRYWRGPVWLVVNRMIAEGLTDYGFDELAARIRGDSATLVETGGFYESFDPTTGNGVGGDRFSWTAAMWLDWASPSALN